MSPNISVSSKTSARNHLQSVSDQFFTFFAFARSSNRGWVNYSVTQRSESIPLMATRGVDHMDDIVAILGAILQQDLYRTRHAAAFRSMKELWLPLGEKVAFYGKRVTSAWFDLPTIFRKECAKAQKRWRKIHNCGGKKGGAKYTTVAEKKAAQEKDVSLKLEKQNQVDKAN